MNFSPLLSIARNFDLEIGPFDAAFYDSKLKVLRVGTVLNLLDDVNPDFPPME